MGPTRTQRFHSVLGAVIDTSHIPSELPDLRRIGRVAIDLETKDNGLATDRGSGWPWRDGHVCGLSLAYRADGQVCGIYLPIRHPDTQNFSPEQVYAWLNDHVASDLRFATHNGPYDWGWLRTEAGIRMPAGERLEEVGALATLTNENRHDYGLDALSKSCGLAGKDESLLREGCAALNLIADKRKKFRPQTYLWQLPARYVGPYAVGDAINTFLVREHFDPILDQENTRAAYRLECDLLPLIVEMRLRGIRIDILAAERARDLLLGKRDTALAQLSDKLGMPVSMDELNRAKWKGEVFDRERVAYPRTEKGNPSFSGDWMEGHAHWLPQLICEAEKQHRAGDKFTGKYILEHTVNGRIHAEIHPFQTEDHGAKSYRFSYSDPPLQQMSARDEEFASIIRGLFLPEEGEVWAKPDASQQEFRIAVHYAAIHNMPKAEIAVQRYCDDPATDFHSLTAQITGLDRKDAKAVNFAKMYGAGVGKFAEMIGKPINEARAIYAQYDRELPFLRALSKAYEYLARHQGYITLYDGARRHFNLWAPGGKWEKRAGPCEREEAERRLDDPNHKWFGKGQLYRTDTHNALNALIQGTAARHTALWMRAVWREGIVPLLQMHDCLDCSVATREQAEMVAQLCVEAVQLKVPMRVDLKFGRTWGDAKHTWEGVQSTTEPAAFVSASTPVAELNESPATSTLVPELEPTPASTAVQSNGAHAGDGARVQDHQSEILTEPVENTMGAYAQCAEVLVERGYATIPIMAGSKAPGFYCAGLWVPLLGWQRRYLHGRTPNYMDHNLWGNGNAGIGVVGGKASHGLVAIDIDTDDPAIKVAIVKVLPPTPVRKIGAKGETAFYFGPDIMTSRSWNIDGKRVCDLIADGRQTVLPPTIHPDTGCPYRWLGLALDAFDPDQLPFLPAEAIGNIDAVLVPLGWQPEPLRTKPGNGGADLDEDANTPHRQLNNFALAHLECWVPKLGLYKCRPARGGYEAVAHWRPSSHGRELKMRARHLSIVPKGIKDFGDGRGGGNGFTYTPLDLVMAANDCDLDTAFKFLCEHTGWVGDRIVTEAPGPEPTVAEAAEPAPAITVKAPEATPAPDATPAPEAKPTPVDELERYARNVPGVMGEVIEWIVATARRPNRVLALAAAIPLVGTLIGRRVAGPTRSATHLYAVAVAPTGAGKQHPIDCIGALMIAAGAQEHLGPGTFMSASALCNYVYRRPLSLCCSDEFGAYLAKLNARGASGHEREVTRIMRSLWGISFALTSTPEWADRVAQQVHSPALSFLGTSTPDELFQSLQGEAIDNGLLNRFLVLRSDMRARDMEPQMLSGQVPADLAMQCRQLYRWHGTDAELIDIKRPVEQQVTQLPWAGKPAEKEYLDFASMVDDRIDQDPALRPFLARAAETAIRLATIRAAGRGFRAATVTVEDVHWGTGIAWTAGQQLCVGAQSVTPVTERGKWVERLISYVRARNLTGDPATVRTFQQHIRCRLKAADVHEMITQLIQIGQLQRQPDGTLVLVAKPLER